MFKQCLFKQFSLIALLAATAAPALAQSPFSQDDLIHDGLLATVIASPLAAMWSLLEAQDVVKQREELEATVPGLPEEIDRWSTLAKIEEDAEKDNSKIELRVWVNRPAIYRAFLDTESTVYQQLMYLNSLSKWYMVTLVGAAATGVAAWTALGSSAQE
jgi:hypothetical protein